MAKPVKSDNSPSAIRVKDDKGPVRDRVGKFRELANKRVSRALRAIRLVGNLSNRSSYAYTDADIDRVCFALEDAIKNLRQRFLSHAPPKDDFTL